MDWSAHFGDVDHDNFVAREDKKVDGLPILRIGNTLTSRKQLNFQSLARNDNDMRYNPKPEGQYGIPTQRFVENHQ